MYKYLNQNVRFAKRAEKNKNKVPIASASGKRVNTYITEEQNKRGREAYSSNGKKQIR